MDTVAEQCDTTPTCGENHCDDHVMLTLKDNN